MIAIACSFAASTPLQAGEARLNSASARSEGDARLIVARVANFGTFNFLNLFVDGVYVANLGYLRSYEAVLPPGRHVLSVTPEQEYSVRIQSLTQNPAGLTHLPRNGKTIMRFTSRGGTALPSKSSLRECHQPRPVVAPVADTGFVPRSDWVF